MVEVIGLHGGSIGLSGFIDVPMLLDPTAGMLGSCLRSTQTLLSDYFLFCGFLDSGLGPPKCNAMDSVRTVESLGHEVLAPEPNDLKACIL